MAHRHWMACVITLVSLYSHVACAAIFSFNEGWRFLRSDVEGAQTRQYPNEINWEGVTLPHTAQIEPLITGQTSVQWQGVCWYRKTFELPESARGKQVFVRFRGAMNLAQVWVNGQFAGRFMGGYLPYVVDLSGLVEFGSPNQMSIRLDNQDNPLTGPKPLKDLDFNMYGGLYRSASLMIKDKLHVTDAILANKPASGGVFVTFPSVSQDQAIVRVKTHVKNADSIDRTFMLNVSLSTIQDKVVVAPQGVALRLAPGEDRQVEQDIIVASPKLWSPKSPTLYKVRCDIMSQGQILDFKETRVGIRQISISTDGFRINGEKRVLRGTNRHQEYPYIGYALSEDAQYREAVKIKEAGFDYVRLSHYPHGPAFLDACDELGLVVMDCLMGWQYFNPAPEFSRLKYRECRDLIRRDRNHPCVILWEVSLNESQMPEAFIAETHRIAHEEYPGDQCFTCGWTQGYDVFIQARQHGGCVSIQDQACVVSEYGDWEYYAQNAGLQQNAWKDLKPAERSSRQLLGSGDTRLLQQALNFQEAHNDNLKTKAFADGLWVMYDYNRGYAKDLESSGVMDIFRLPKFSYQFFRSQRDPDERIANVSTGPMVFIANHWTAQSPLTVRVFSNCQEVALSLNGTLIERRRPDTDRLSTHLAHAPFTFQLDRFEPGQLRAQGFINGVLAAQSERRSPGKVTSLALRFDLSTRPFSENGKDQIFCYAEFKDRVNQVVSQAKSPVFFGLYQEGARLIGHTPIESEAGIATILLQSNQKKATAWVFALSFLQENNQTSIISTVACPNRNIRPRYDIHYSVDGSEPTINSQRYRGPIEGAAPRLRVALVANEMIVLRADTQTKASSTERVIPN